MQGGLSQPKFGELLCIQRTSLSNWERGCVPVKKKRLARLDMLERAVVACAAQTGPDGEPVVVASLLRPTVPESWYAIIGVTHGEAA